MTRTIKIAAAFVVLMSLSLKTFPLSAQTQPVRASAQDTSAIEAIIHSNPSDHVTEDVSFTNIFGSRSLRAR
jgi:hypothetical protein